MSKQFNKFSLQAFGQEYPFLWEPYTGAKIIPDKNAFKAERKIMQYYFSNSSQNRYKMLLLGLLFFIWVFVNYRNVKKRNVVLNSEEFKVHFLRSVPFFSSCVVMLTMSPFFDLHPPTIYVDVLQFFLLLAPGQKNYFIAGWGSWFYSCFLLLRISFFIL